MKNKRTLRISLLSAVQSIRPWDMVVIGACVIIIIVVFAGLNFVRIRASAENWYEDTSFALAPSGEKAFEIGERHFDGQDVNNYDVRRAAKYFQKAKALDPNLLYVHHELARIAFLHGDFGAAMAQIDAIAAVEGVDGVFIGPNDLAADMGHLGNWQHPEVWKVMEDAAKRITRAGKAPGILVGEADGQRCLDLGYLFVAVGSDLVMLARGTEALAAKFRK